MTESSNLEGNDDGKNVINHFVDETPYYVRPRSIYDETQEIENDALMPVKKQTSTALFVVAGLIGIITLGTVILSDD